MMIKIFSIAFLIFIVGCAVPVSNNSVTDVIDDTFFYKSDGSFLQYPRQIWIDSLEINNCWFYNDTFITVSKYDSTSKLMCDTTISNYDDYSDTDISCYYKKVILLKAYIMPDKSRFKYSKEIN